MVKGWMPLAIFAHKIPCVDGVIFGDLTISDTGTCRYSAATINRLRPRVAYSISGAAGIIIDMLRC
ncbi:hypothetical protein ACHEUO_22305 [Klebsiella oxytoca]|uniref:hypothetical protein n=1 Tax=Klebsiella oxytoca TaxID=571 RepID=UPI00375697D1|nr:hypothetical protein [Klebsiella oxytoca]